MNDEAQLHWNDEIPGPWYESGNYRGEKIIGSYIGRVNDRPGVYRLIAMADMERWTPMVLSRIAGSDNTGTLYIGCASSLRRRLIELKGSLREPGHHRYLGKHVGGRLSQIPLLREMFPPACLAVAWVFTKYPERLEKNLLWHYEKCFGEIPPLNTERGDRWFEPPDAW